MLTNYFSPPLSALLAIIAVLSTAGCDDKASSTKSTTSAAQEGGNSAGRVLAPTDGASAQGSDIQGIMLMHEAEVAIEKGDLGTAKVKLEALDAIKANLSTGLIKTLEEVRAKVLSPATAPATVPSN